MNNITRIIFSLYTATGLLREQVLVTVFGYKSHCKHSPTCSRYTYEMIQQKGIGAGLVLGIRRLATCW